MSLTLFNSLTRSKEPFSPIDPANVRMYVCGPTVYDYAHIGNARPAIVFDVLFRLLRHLYGKDHVTYVRNITDVDDKINARARQEYPDLPLNAAVARVTERTTKQYHADIAALGCLPPTVEPTCTSHIPDMVKMIQELIAHGCAYVAEGHVLFEVAKAKDYGALSRRSLDEMMAGARVEVVPYKKNPMDFVLWKPSDEDTPGWPSPWGRGRPGWHIECSAMSAKHLGKVFDIHGGGIDLQFPHHENELAQNRCAFGTDVMANVWMHNGFLQVEGQKMSKSLGNFITIHELLETDKFGGEVWFGAELRLSMLLTHYSKPKDWTVSELKFARDRWTDWANVERDQLIKIGISRSDVDAEWVSPTFISALEDDLNTPLALSVLFGLGENAHSDPKAGRAFLAGLSLLGLEGWSMRDRNESKREEIAAQVEHLVAARSAARAAKNWAEADRIRGELSVMGVQLMDSKDPKTGEIVTTWEVKR